MARKVTPSQIRSMVRQQQSKLRQAVQKYERDVRQAERKWFQEVNREIDRVNQHNKRIVDNHNRRVRQHNQNQRSAVAKYNRAVKSHNTQVERDRQRRLAALRATSSTHFTEVRTSTFSLSDQYERVSEAAASANFSDLLQLSEREAENSAALAETLFDKAAPVIEGNHDTGILEYLSGFSDDLCDRWRGALHALSPTNPDAARHFCTSVREIFSEILTNWADDDDVAEDDPNCERTQQGTPSRRAKIRYLLRKKGADTPEMLGFVEQDIEDILQLFPVFNKGTHGTAGAFTLTSLKALRQRVEGGIMFLAAVAL